MFFKLGLIFFFFLACFKKNFSSDIQPLFEENILSCASQLCDYWTDDKEEFQKKNLSLKRVLFRMIHLYEQRIENSTDHVLDPHESFLESYISNSYFLISSILKSELKQSPYLQQKKTKERYTQRIVEYTEKGLKLSFSFFMPYNFETHQKYMPALTTYPSFDLASLFEEGTIFNQNLERARYYYIYGALQWHTDSMYSLAEFYEKGWGGPIDRLGAFNIYKHIIHRDPYQSSEHKVYSVKKTEKKIKELSFYVDRIHNSNTTPYNAFLDTHSPYRTKKNKISGKKYPVRKSRLLIVKEETNEDPS